MKELQHTIEQAFEDKTALTTPGAERDRLKQSVEELLANNDLALYDTRLDPEEMDNLADPNNPNYDEELLATMNTKLNELIKTEIGEDKALFTPPS